MTNEELFDDLKQFVAATVSQEIDGLRTELKADIEALDDKIDLIDQKLDQVQDAIAETLTDANHVTNESISGVEIALEHHERRLVQLEERQA